MIFFFNDTATTEIYTLSLHDALPIFVKRIMEGKPVIIHGDGTSLWTITHNSDFAKGFIGLMGNPHAIGEAFQITCDESVRSEEHTSELQSRQYLVCRLLLEKKTRQYI